MAEGIVKWFSNKKGYGFIEQDNGPDIFVHYSSIDMQGFKTLRGGDRVAFEVNDSDRGPEADKAGLMRASRQDLPRCPFCFWEFARGNLILTNNACLRSYMV